MKLLSRFLTLSAAALFATTVVAAPAPAETVKPPKGGCRPSYTRGKDYKFDWEDINIHFYYGTPPAFVRINMTTPRGEGYVYTNYAANITKPWLFPNIAAWQTINCAATEFIGKDESRACGSSNSSVKALYSPGKSPWDPEVKPIFGTTKFINDYAVAGLESFYVTPIRLPSDAKTAKFEVTGYKVDGSKVTYTKTFNVKNEKRFQITGLVKRGFTEIKALEFWLSVERTGGYEFAIDDLALHEYLAKPLPEHCTAPTTTAPLKGPCTPKPTRTLTWTYNANEFITPQPVPTLYKSLNWPSYVQAVNQSYISWVNPPETKPSSGKYMYYGYSPVSVLAHTYEQRFGVDNIALACGFPQYTDPSSGVNPCFVSFVGYRDPYDGSGLPYRVVANVTIPNPGNFSSQSLTMIDLNKITDSPGKFRNLYSFNIFARVGYSGYDTHVFFDDLVVNRGQNAKNCRVPGGDTLNFDDIAINGTTPVQVPSVYKGFKFDPTWAVIKRTNYPPNSAGYKAVISPRNALWSGFNRNPDVYTPPSSIDSYISPVNNFLWDFEEAVITLDTPPSANFSATNVVLYVSVTDACGSGSDIMWNSDRHPYLYYRSLIPEGDSIQIKFAEPIKAISKILFNAYRLPDYERVDVFVDDFRYRKYEGVTPGCRACGYRASDWCEVPRIFR